MSSPTTISVLFVCMGNICRSPMAEAVFRGLVEEAGLTERVRIDSAGTHSYNLGEPPHDGTITELAARGVEPGDQISRLVTVADLDTFDHVVAMDADNRDGLLDLAAGAADPERARARVVQLLELATETDLEDVPDPYYVGGFDVVYELVLDGAQGLLELVERELGAP